jgi:hypothetical protein
MKWKPYKSCMLSYGKDVSLYGSQMHQMGAVCLRWVMCASDRSPYGGHMLSGDGPTWDMWHHLGAAGIEAM